MSARGSVYKRCGCRVLIDGKQRQLGRKCPKLRRSDHGSYAFSVRVNGKLIRESGFDTKAAAQDALDSLRRRSLVTTPTAITVKEFLDTWVIAKSKDLKPNTLAQYRRYVDGTFVPTLGSMKLTALRPAHVNDMLSDHAPVAAQRMRAVLRSALTDAMRESLVTINAAGLARNPASTRSPRPLVWTTSREAEWRKAKEAKLPFTLPSSSMVWRVDHVKQFLTATKDHDLYALFHLMLHTGMRRGEVCGLQWSDLSDHGMLTIERQVIDTYAGIIVDTPKTSAGARSLPLATTTLGVLEKHRVGQCERFGDEPTWLFTGPTGAMLKPNYVTKEFKRAVNDANLPPIRLHDVRHSAASLMLAAGTPMKVVSDTLGHSGIEVTANIYAAVYDDAHTAAADAMSRLIAGV